MSADNRLVELGITLPAVPTPAGLYSPVMQAGELLVVSGQLPNVDGALPKRGKCGAEVTIEEGAGFARQCALNALALVQQHLGSLDRVKQTVRVAGYVASAEGFTDHPRVINGASQVLLDVFGEAGRHARIAIGVAELPNGAPVEVEFMFQVHPA
jgi:enamine deaminase RidA (YjgF/YER057c/UK114 family)